jgi:hypothetical protein
VAEQDPKKPERAKPSTFEPGETNARAVRNENPTGGTAGTAGAAAPTADRGTTGPVQSGMKRIRMIRTEGDRRGGQVLVLPQDEADRLLNSGAAETVQTS